MSHLHINLTSIKQLGTCYLHKFKIKEALISILEVYLSTACLVMHELNDLLLQGNANLESRTSAQKSEWIDIVV